MRELSWNRIENSANRCHKTVSCKSCFSIFVFTVSFRLNKPNIHLRKLLTETNSIRSNFIIIINDNLSQGFYEILKIYFIHNLQENFQHFFKTWSYEIYCLFMIKKLWDSESGFNSNNCVLVVEVLNNQVNSCHQMIFVLEVVFAILAINPACPWNEQWIFRL